MAKNDGMELRDWFAGRAMQALVGSDADGLAKAIMEGKGSIALSTARLSYAIADAMLKERAR